MMKIYVYNDPDSGPHYVRACDAVQAAELLTAAGIYTEYYKFSRVADAEEISVIETWSDDDRGGLDVQQIETGTAAQWASFGEPGWFAGGE